ncbi:alpha/beta hydrolase domain-containing protein [Pseudofrankia sp. BMG5.37]|uniref:alpha/beta hydrolase domain-containing protein n=1 Tax=Pseudofrankia sp. BMG5.37 TaxID=3050035 RepID=UPI0028953015|nr:alpha/beta hydrolase domain-containing protein [Pseudofrankia sp. BMG5.37]MDT3446399.1 alpha/beta hydrolase domain-containing protein [Pseudofrankia sp. BMG5.37]
MTGPVAGGTPAEFVFSTNFDLAKIGYKESEFFLSGTATSYTSGSPLTSDGKWAVSPNGTAPYTTRAVVRRPVDPRKFNGTVVVEWLNVSGGVDAGPDWTLTHNELVREGFAWVGVSAQWTGVQTAKGNNPALLPGDPVRYAPLSHPGDSYSYDIYSQAGQALRGDSALMLGGLKPRKLIAAGESQSAARLVTYIDAVHPLARVYDGFLVHSRNASGAALAQAAPPATAPTVPAPSPALIRDDLNVPVFVFQTETDVFNSNLAARQPDTKRFRAWEVAGTAHFDDYGLQTGPADVGDGQGAVLNLAAMQNPPTNTSAGACMLPINTGGAHWVLDAAVYWLNQWVVNRVDPPRGQPLQTTGTSPVVFAKDANGNALGGVRSPQVDAPVATLGGVGNTPAFCSLFGTTVPFSAGTLAGLYKNHGQFVVQWSKAVAAGVVRGFLRPADAVELENAAVRSQIGN